MILKLKQSLTLILLMLGTTFGVAQQNVTGLVSDGDGPLPGVTIIEKGTSNGTTSDFDGNFTISVSGEDAILVISYLGFITQELSANADAGNIIMKSGSDELEEVVVTGYGSQRKATITGAVASIKGENIETTFNDTIRKTQVAFSEFRQEEIRKRIESVAIEKGYLIQQGENKDREFTTFQKFKLWKKQNGKSTITSKEIPLTEIYDHTKWQADHIKSWDQGGLTTIDNGQLIEASINASLGNKMNKEITA